MHQTWRGTGWKNHRRTSCVKSATRAAEIVRKKNAVNPGNKHPKQAPQKLTWPWPFLLSLCLCRGRFSFASALAVSLLPLPFACAWRLAPWPLAFGLLAFSPFLLFSCFHFFTILLFSFSQCLSFCFSPLSLFPFVSCFVTLFFSPFSQICLFCHSCILAFLLAPRPQFLAHHFRIPRTLKKC